MKARKILNVGAVVSLFIALGVGYYAGYKHGRHTAWIEARTGGGISRLREVDVTNVTPFGRTNNKASVDQYFTPRNFIPGEFKR
ncbi:MAG: hypothetical protein HY043_01990 [Verrucomicrobia bacterium]|nr:hypothetical protein [Verrucomicrobiota bacterium]